MKSPLLRQIIAGLLRCAFTLAVIIAGVHAARLCWKHYRTEPWTRDGRVNAEIVRIVPEVSGKILQLHVKDNQMVNKGDVLLTIDPESLALVLQEAEANLATRQADLSLRREQAERRKSLVNVKAISAEEHNNAVSAVAVAEAAVGAATATRDIAKLNLERSTVISPVNGYVTNLHLREGDYATAGQEQFAIIDRDSFWIAGYFEETKLAAIHPGDAAQIDLMGGSRPLSGHVESISRGISDPATTGKGLANVDPVFNWVRLAQRIPVRIHLDEFPPDVFLSSGMSCNVKIVGESAVIPSPESKFASLLPSR